MNVISGNDLADGTPSEYENGAAPTIPSSPIHYFPPAVRQAAFNSRSSSHSSMGSFHHRGPLNDGDHQLSRPSTPLSIAAPESIASNGQEQLLLTFSFVQEWTDTGW
ncbi:hypothetical protein GHT06_014038 [Daphnia sinensis]|uniref:Uncharacterized protein n=1 Tax=Daphnia sinensis TaxID=1820382 RepID=A0AAD5LLK3_9CRUS|nr:hypothetical protein GHT06_014038 [Daphnia sinensis]